MKRLIIALLSLLMLVTVFSGCDVISGSVEESKSYEEYIEDGFEVIALEEEADIEILFKSEVSESDNTLLCVEAVVASYDKKEFLSNHLSFTFDTKQDDIDYLVYENDNVEVYLNYSEAKGGITVHYLFKISDEYNNYLTNEGYIPLDIKGNSDYKVFYKREANGEFYFLSVGVYSVSKREIVKDPINDIKIPTGGGSVFTITLADNEIIKISCSGGVLTATFDDSPHTHSFTNGYISDGGKHTGICSCGETDYPELCSLGDFKSDDKNHWQTCSVCGFTAKSAHTVVNGKCTVCNKTFDTESKGLEFTEASGGYAVISLGSCTDKNLYIPSTHNGKPVVAIGGFAFAGTDIESVYIPESVTEIGAFAFSNCTKLKGELVIRGSGNVIISESAFTGCSSLTKLTVASHFSEILADAFSHCTGLKEIHFDNPFVSSFDIHTFAYCSSLEKIKVGGLSEDWIIIFENSVGGEGELEDLSWYANSGNFIIEFDDGSTMTKSELIALYSFE